jgi:hypothetical protein
MTIEAMFDPPSSSRAAVASVSCTEREIARKALQLRRCHGSIEHQRVAVAGLDSGADVKENWEPEKTPPTDVATSAVIPTKLEKAQRARPTYPILKLLARSAEGAAPRRSIEPSDPSDSKLPPRPSLVSAANASAAVE